MALPTYSPKDVVCTIAGFHTVVGYADGTFINITKDAQSVTITRAMDGTASRVYGPDEGWHLELTLMQSSATNDILSSLWNVDKVTQLGKFPVMVRDTLGTSMFMAATCWIETPPDITFGAELETRTWKIACTECAVNIGGSGKLGLAGALGISSSALPLLDHFGVL